MARERQSLSSKSHYAATRCFDSPVSSPHWSFRSVKWKDQMQRGLQDCWSSAQRWCTLTSEAIMASEQPGQRGLQESWGSAGSWCTSISMTIGSARLGQKVLQECWGSAQPCLTSISGTMTSALSGKGGFELRGGVKPLTFVCRHLGQLALCHMFSRRETRKIDMLYTYRVVVFWLPLSLWAKPV